MLLIEMLAEVQSLSRLEKIQLIQFLAHDLEQNETDLIETGGSYPIVSSDATFSAAETLLQALEEEKDQH